MRSVVEFGIDALENLERAHFQSKASKESLGKDDRCRLVVRCIQSKVGFSTVLSNGHFTREVQAGLRLGSEFDEFLLVENKDEDVIYFGTNEGSTTVAHGPSSHWGAPFIAVIVGLALGHENSSTVVSGEDETGLDYGE